ncbi:DUF6248 family natural product biosynthesis protein [Nocardiopsis sp. NPDC057823]|uniref:DUF6248 family natural product biosynthesis protein n=1 Tax=Nocardiopsis sp. NPDC057823 TaxID=3346256 RepID=UPI0036735ED6
MNVYLPGDGPRARPRRIRSRSGAGHPAQMTACACQWGSTGHCRNGNHSSCRAGVAELHAETYLTYADGACVVDPATGQPIEAWPAGRPCRWVCPCSCHTAAAAPDAEWHQPTLFALEAS